jgi:hypothetical protein
VSERLWRRFGIRSKESISSFSTVQAPSHLDLLAAFPATMTIKRFALLFVGLALLSLGTPAVHAQATATAPKSVVHIITVKFKEGTTPAQIKAAMDGAHQLPSAFKGIIRVWTNAIKVQGDKTHVIVMEFADAAALKAYDGSAAQKKWYEAYLGIREESTTFDVTN